MKKAILIPVAWALLSVGLPMPAQVQPGLAVTDSLIKKDSMNLAPVGWSFLPLLRQMDHFPVFGQSIRSGS